MPDAPTRLAVPLPAPPPARPPFPLIAALAPVVASVALWALTGSALALLFAVLGPVVAVAGLLDALRQRRGARRREQRRYRVSLDALEERIAAALDERLARAGRRPDPGDPVSAHGIAAAWAASAEPVLVLGLADQTSGVVLDGEPEGLEPAARERLSVLRERAAVLPGAPLAVPAPGGVGIAGPEAAARALARELLLQLAAQLGPDRAAVVVPPGEEWAEALPHPLRLDGPPGRMELLVARAGEEPLRLPICWAPAVEELAEPVATLLRLAGEQPAAVLRSAGSAGERFAPAALGRAEARGRAELLAAIAEQHGLRGRRSALPERLRLAELPDPEGSDGLAVVLGVADDGPVLVDLLRDGPHALVAGTTGSGKSELLVAWVLALARRHPPGLLAFLLVDFKGGASFAPLVGLPHVAGMVSDLDARRARRAMTGLRAELRRRERVLAEAAVRSIEELPAGGLPRLVVVVDEYAAVVADHPELHEVFTDLAARGRSLGVHLVLCTQRPSGVVREAILANTTLRIALRLVDRADSHAVLGGDAAAQLPAGLPGRAVVAADGRLRTVQLALAEPADAERARQAHPAAASASQPWADPLPTRLARAALGPARPGSIAFGLADLPDEQRHAPACYEPRRHGGMAVTGAPRSGRSTALACLVEAAPGAVVVPGEPAGAWGLLDELAAEVEAGRGPPLVVIDDLDELLAGAGSRHAPGLVERIERLLRRGPAAGTGLALAAGRVDLPALRGVEARLLLRQPGRDEHLLAGLDARDHDPDAPPGAGWWRGRAVQVALPARDPAELLAAAVRQPEVPLLTRASGYAVVSTRPAEEAARWRAAGLAAVDVGSAEPAAASSSGAVLVGDPDAWQAAWSLLAAARRELAFLADRRVPAAELRALTRVRDEPPPLAEDRDDEWWLADDGRVLRVRLGG